MKIPGIFQRPAGSGVWWISYYDADGKRHREKAGRRMAAIDAVTRRHREVTEGRFVAPGKSSRLTFRDLARVAMAQKKLRLAPLSYETDEQRLAKLLPMIGNVPADRLNPARLEETLSQLKGSGIANSTVNRYHSLISSIYSSGIRFGRVAFNPASRVKRYRESEGRVRWLRPEEEERIRGVLRNVVQHEAEFDLALHTGMRRGEQFWLRWRDVDLERGNLTVTGKTGTRHVVANQTAIAALQKLLAIGAVREFVCPDNDGSSKRDCRTWFTEAIAQAGVTDFHWHDVRHTFASRLVMRGVDIRTVQELLGHKSIVMTQKYAHLAEDHRAAAVAKMNA